MGNMNFQTKQLISSKCFTFRKWLYENLDVKIHENITVEMSEEILKDFFNEPSVYNTEKYSLANHPFPARIFWKFCKLIADKWWIPEIIEPNDLGISSESDEEVVIDLGDIRIFSIGPSESSDEEGDICLSLKYRKNNKIVPEKDLTPEDKRIIIEEMRKKISKLES